MDQRTLSANNAIRWLIFVHFFATLIAESLESMSSKR
jgi:hypothetical protein